METLLLGYDGSPEAERALERAAVLAGALPARVVVVTVDTLARGLLPDHDPAPRHEAEAAGARLRERGVDASVREGSGEPAKALAEIAREEDAGMVVVGGRDLTWLDRLIGGSTSDAVAHRVGADVLIVHT